MWSGLFVKAWSKLVGVLALSSGESELAAVLRGATISSGLQSYIYILNFVLCCHVAIKQAVMNSAGWCSVEVSIESVIENSFRTHDVWTTVVRRFLFDLQFKICPKNIDVETSMIASKDQTVYCRKSLFFNS